MTQDKQDEPLSDDEIYQESLLTEADCLEIERLRKSYGTDIFYGDTNSERHSFATNIVVGRKVSRALLTKVYPAKALKKCYELSKVLPSVIAILTKVEVKDHVPFGLTDKLWDFVKSDVQQALAKVQPAKIMGKTDDQRESNYSPAEAQMIMCITRERVCTPERCLKCGWLRNETRERLNKDQEQFTAAQGRK